jgi:predicted NUDIX family phosphoesterase
MEFVLVVPRTELFPDCTPHGFVPFEGGALEERFWSSVEHHGHFVERAYAERTPSLKQVIPYSIVVRRGTAPGGEVLRLRRTRRGGEIRLHDKLSIGVGGHINPVDARSATDEETSRRACIARATRREVVEEELSVEGPWEVTDVGLLNDDTNPVGAVHVGLVQVVTVEGSVAVRETDQLEGSFASLDELRRELAGGANFETWSSLLIPHLGRLVPPPNRNTTTDSVPRRDGALQR